MRSSTLRIVGIVALSTFIAAGCGGSSSAPSQPTPTPSPNCSSMPPPGLPIPAFPAGGATNVPANIGIIILEVLDPWPSTGIQVTDGSNTSVAVTPTSVPSPLPTGLPAQLPYEAVAVPVLAPKTTYTISQVASASASCPNNAYTLGSFTTQ